RTHSTPLGPGRGARGRDRGSHIAPRCPLDVPRAVRTLERCHLLVRGNSRQTLLSPGRITLTLTDRGVRMRAGGPVERDAGRAHLVRPDSCLASRITLYVGTSPPGGP